MKYENDYELILQAIGKPSKLIYWAIDILRSVINKIGLENFERVVGIVLRNERKKFYVERFYLLRSSISSAEWNFELHSLHG